MAKSQVPAQPVKVIQGEVAAEEKSTALALQRSSGALVGPTEEAPEWMDLDDKTGKGGISRDEIRLPRLAIAQGLSPQMLPGKPEFIEGLSMFDLFNDVTGEIYGKGPLYFIAAQRSVARVQFRPREQGGGLVDANVPPDDPRLQGSKDPATGKWTPPLATVFVEFAAMLLHSDRQPEPIVISIKTTNKQQRNAAKDLTTFINTRRGSIFSRLYTVESATASNDKGTYGVYKFRDLDRLQVKELYDFAGGFAKSLTGKTITVQRVDEEPNDPDDSMAANPEGGGAPPM